VVVYGLYALAVLDVVAAIGRFVMIGKRREPYTRGVAIAGAIFCAVSATILLIAASRLS
jgi:hypothetical protein